MAALRRRRRRLWARERGYENEGFGGGGGVCSGGRALSDRGVWAVDTGAGGRVYVYVLGALGERVEELDVVCDWHWGGDGVVRMVCRDECIVKAW